MTDGDRGPRFYTSGLNFILGVAIGTLVSGVAKSALRPATIQPRPPQYR
jgi:hypothetical protein